MTPGPHRPPPADAGEAPTAAPSTPGERGPADVAPTAGEAPTAASGDAVRLDEQAHYDRALAAQVADQHGRAVISAQLGRPARGRPAVVHRCVFGLPTVVRVDPRLDDGTPFPTTFWLTCPVLRSRVGRLEANQSMVGLNERLSREPDLAADYAAAHERYVAARDRLGPAVPGNPSAGGMPGRVKCLHVHLAHHLATGDNVIGMWTASQVLPAPCDGPCVSDAEVAAWRDRLEPSST